MPLVTSQNILEHARKNFYAIPAFNCENMEMIQAIIAAGEDMKSPIILQTTPSTVRYASVELFAGIAKAAAQKAAIPVALHLDHGDSLELVNNALSAGYTSIMIDGSHLALDQNIALTKKAVDICVKKDIPVEGELGRVGGKEDDLESDSEGYTDPKEAVQFFRETGVSFLAIGVGTSHGIYAQKPILNPALISELKDIIPIPLVLHGSSGLEEHVVRDCISRGICKVNIATDLRITYTEAVRDFLINDPKCIDPKKFGHAAREAVKKLVKKHIMICGCNDRALI